MGKISKTMSIIAGTTLLVGTTGCYRTMPITQTVEGEMSQNFGNTRPGFSDVQLGGGNNKVAMTRPVTIYKTTKDYSQNVPVIMNADRTEIVSYPDPKDIRKSSKPTQLNNGYLLDNRGIGENVAFLSYTYDEYSKLASAPSREQLMNSIIDKHPLTTIVDCGHASDYSGNLVDALNEYISNNKLK